MVPTPTESAATALKRQQILQGALDIFLQEGFEGASMDRVAATAGVSKITIYKYFDDKEGLFTALIEHIAAQRFAQVADSLPLTEDPEQVLSAMAHRLLNVLTMDEQYAGFLRLIIGESGRFPHLAQLFIQALPQKVWHLLTHYFEHHPELHLPDAEATARIFTGSLISYAMTQHILHGQAIAPMPPEPLIHTLVALVVQHREA